ncbi:hypothetical protein PTKU64_94330 (plasmid) [Paraburkholderia terrae]|uniref:Uncharacterized protein n=1 Tax=Paraburkholderia terrae TaxID=311230 RepID=A0ABN6K1K1_9BURK|nr:hypothetical protein PTKU64_94330 [Paraburkholderia terrae]
MPAVPLTHIKSNRVDGCAVIEVRTGAAFEAIDDCYARSPRRLMEYSVEAHLALKMTSVAPRAFCAVERCIGCLDQFVRTGHVAFR